MVGKRSQRKEAFELEVWKVGDREQESSRNSRGGKYETITGKITSSTAIVECEVFI